MRNTDSQHDKHPVLNASGGDIGKAGQPLSAAARLLLSGSQAPAPALAPQLVLRVATPELAEGLLQWPGTRALIRERLGPTALAIADENVELLRQRLEELGVKLVTV